MPNKGNPSGKLNIKDYKYKNYGVVFHRATLQNRGKKVEMTYKRAFLVLKSSRELLYYF